jgi:hypothetical protein
LLSGHSRARRVRASRGPWRFTQVLREKARPSNNPLGESQIQAYDRNPAGLADEKGTMIYDYKGHDTTALFAAAADTSGE